MLSIRSERKRSTESPLIFCGGRRGGCSATLGRFDFDDLAGGALGGDPVHGQEFFEFVLCRIVHEFFKDPFEVGVGVELVTTDLLDEGVDDGAAPAGFFATNEHPVLRAEFCGTDGSFGVVVIKLDLAVEEARFKVRPLVTGVRERFPKLAFGKDSAVFFEMVEEFSEMVVVSAGFEPAGTLPIQGGGFLFLQAFFDAVDFADLADDPSADPGVIVAGFPEFPPDVGEATDGDDVESEMTLDEGAVGSQAVALEVSVEGGLAVFADEDLIEASVGSAFVPVEERAVFGVLVDPEVAGGGFPFAGFEAWNGCLINANVVAHTDALGDEVVEGQEPPGEMIVPVAHDVAFQIDAVAGFEFPLFAVEGAVVAKFLGEEVGAQRGGEDALREEAGFKRWGEGNGVGVVLEDMGLTLDEFAHEGGGGGMKTDGGDGVEKTVEVRIGKDLGVDDGARLGWKSFE